MDTKELIGKLRGISNMRSASSYKRAICKMAAQRLEQLTAEDDGWISVKDGLPEDGVIVRTKIHDENGSRNEGKLKRRGNLWFLPDGSMYVYYTPTHWMPLPEPPKPPAEGK